MALKSELYQKKVNVRENMDVVSLMTLTAENFTSDTWTSELLRRAARLLCKTTDCWEDTLEALKVEEFAYSSEHLLRVILGSNNEGSNDEETNPTE